MVESALGNLGPMHSAYTCGDQMTRGVSRDGRPVREQVILEVRERYDRTLTAPLKHRSRSKTRRVQKAETQILYVDLIGRRRSPWSILRLSSRSEDPGKGMDLLVGHMDRNKRGRVGHWQ